MPWRRGIAMGYTDPFVKNAGLNFLVAVLATFAQGDPNKMLADDVVSAFEAFQRGVPFVALTTPQMRDSVQNDRSLEAFIVNRAVFAKPRLPVRIRFYPLWHPARQSALRHRPAHHGETRSLTSVCAVRLQARKSWRRVQGSTNYQITRPPLRLRQARCSQSCACGSARKTLGALS